MIETIYNNQLDAILYSVNQYSNDVISSWATKVDVLINTTHKINGEKTLHFSNELPGVFTIFQYDINIKPINEQSLTDDLKGLHQKVTQMLTDSIKTIKTLDRYLSAGGYRKIEPFNLGVNDFQLLVFLVKTDETTVVNGLIINSLTFIEDVLDPKIQEIAQNKFYIGAYIDDKTNIIYNSDKNTSDIDFQYSKPFWFFDNYYLGIELKEEPISELVKSRSQKNIIIILIIDIVLLLGAGMIYRNMKKQNELAELKSGFISNVSHEIRTPLALISMYIETLELNRVRTEEKKKEYYSIIYQETQRLSSLVNKILNFSQIDSNKKKYSFSNTNVNHIVKKVVNTFKYHLIEKQFELEESYHENLPEISADSESIADIVVNLVDNSIKYSAENKSISISTGVAKNKVFIEIKDKGIGISENDQKKIFDKFYRVTEKNLAHKAKGSGLGLSIVKHIMNKHNGKIEIESKVGEGSCFRLLFPSV